MKYCTVCGQVIPQLRIDALPHTTTCVKCSDVQKYVGVNDYTSKNTSSLVLIDPRNKEDMRIAQNYQNQTRGFGVAGGWK